MRIFKSIVAGVPTILGSLVGGFTYSPTLAIVLLAIGVGSIFDVVFTIVAHMSRGAWKNLYTPPHVLGFFASLCVMYVTGFLVV